MSNLFTKYMDQKNNLISTYYEHHKFRPRSVKTKQMLRNTIQSNPTAHQRQRNFQTTQRSSRSMMSKGRLSLGKLKTNNRGKQQSIGRSLFKKQIENNKNLGPGIYSPTFRKSMSFGYIQRQAEFNDMPSKKIKDRKAQFLGPGRYYTENQQTMLSSHRAFKGLAFSSQKLIRCIISKQKIDKMNLKLNQETQIWRRKLGPGCYNVQKSQSALRKPLCFAVSMTSRSSLIKKQKIPGPGYYDWNTQIKSKRSGQNKKPRIQYKFVHGHA